MNGIRLAENINRLRLEQKLTQEDVANFLGITKASVSKWENGQSLPDILLLPQLATFFNVTIDELIGYEPVLSPEQIKKVYQELANDFAYDKPDTVMEKVHTYVHKYYACYPFLIQIALLLINHFMLFPDKEKQFEILTEAKKLCNRVTNNSKDIVLIDNGISLGTMCELLMGNAKNVIDTLEPMSTIYRLSGQNDLILTQAYQLDGNTEKALTFTQVCMYLHLLNMIETSIQYLEINHDNIEVCEETIRRIENLIELFKVKTLNSNSAARFFFQAAFFYGLQENREKTLHYLSLYCDSVTELIGKGIIEFKGDEYFNKVSQWMESSELRMGPPRNVELVFQSSIEVFKQPVFKFLEKEEAYILLHKRIESLNIKEESLCRK